MGPKCNGFAFSSPRNHGAPNRCYVYTRGEDIPSGWATFTSEKWDIGSSSGAVGVQCFILTAPATTSMLTSMITTTSTSFAASGTTVSFRATTESTKPLLPSGSNSAFDESSQLITQTEQDR